MKSRDSYQAFDYFSALNTDTVLQPTYISLPTVAGQAGYTSIVNRAQIIDLANDCGCRFGVERIQTQQLYEIQNESGPNGERVWGLVGDKYGQVRFVYSSISNANDIHGQYVQGSGLGFIEVTFYGTGLNALVLGSESWSSRDIRVSYDGGSETALTYTSSLLASRNYSGNVIFPVFSNLTLGLHTVKIRNNVGNGSTIHGFEVLNETAGAKTLNIRPGKIVGNNSKAVITSAKTPTYDASVDAFESGTLGTKGGCVIVYAKDDGTVTKAVTPTSSASPKYLTNADHVTDNEELIRTILWRELGCGRADDFSRLAGTPYDNRAFTLDDGTTTLVHTTSWVSSDETLGTGSGSGQGFTLTFVGSGLDFIGRVDSGTANVNVNGTLVGTLAASTVLKTYRVASGLPFGTHTVKFYAGTSNTYVLAFKVYAPKTPTLPSFSKLINKYYIMADYAATTTTGLETISTGVLRKEIAQRETIYVGTWNLNSIDTVNYIGGWECWSNTATNYCEYNFFGTGFNHRFYLANTSGANWTYAVYDTNGNNVALNGVGISTGAFPTGLVFTSSTGVLTGNPASNTAGCGVNVSGLALGKYKLRITYNSGAFLRNEVLDVITPVYYPKNMNEVDGTVQNTLPVGSCSLGDMRKIVDPNAKPQKIVATAVGVTSAPTTTSVNMIPCPDMSVTVNSPGSWFDCFGCIMLSNNTVGTGNYIQLAVDGVLIPSTFVSQAAYVAGYVLELTTNQPVYLSKGAHKIDVYWGVSAGTATLYTTNRRLIVEER